jgi:uncharacterized protein (DUF305 family)
VANVSVNNNMTGMMNLMGMRNIGAGPTNNIDRHFIEQMIPHHEDAIVMAELALERSQNPELKQFAQDIITTQSAEIDKMKQWYKSWFDANVPAVAVRGMGMMHGNMSNNEADIASLNSAADFDQAFLQAMIPHHQMAVMMASMLQVGTDRPEMNQLASDIIAAQTNEIKVMQQWQKDWDYD